MVERVCDMAKLAPPDPYAGIADKDQLATEFKDFDLVSQEFPDAQDLRKLAEETEAIALSVPGITRSNGSGASSSDTTSAFVTSNGFARVRRGTGFGLGVSVVAGEGTAMERDYDGHGAAHFSDLELPEKIAMAAATRAVKRLNPRKVSSQSVPIIFDRRVATSLMGHALSAINGAAIARGTSFLKEALGSQVFSPAITIIDDPHRMRGSASRSSDGEGLPTKRRALFDKGVPENWILDLKSARQLKLVASGQGGRGGPTSFNTHIEAGEDSPEDLIKGVKRGLLVTEFIGSSINMATGDYSRGCSGYWIENGELAYPVSEVTIAGNLKDMFKAMVPANDLIFRSSSNAPSILVGGMTIAGK
jgi:PmbA protein